MRVRNAALLLYILIQESSLKNSLILVKGWGLARWAQPILSVIFDGVNDTVDYQLRELLPPARDGTKRYYRFQTRLDEGNDDLDDAGRTNIRVLKLLAEEIIRRDEAELNMLCNQLVQ